MPGRHILVVEDCDEDFETVEDAARCAALRYPLVRANSGEECLCMCRNATRRRTATPVLVLLDLNMPGDDGRIALREFRRDESLRAVPLVVLSGSVNPRDVQFCYASGANAYHVKPVQYALHLQVLQQIFGYWLGSVALLT